MPVQKYVPRNQVAVNAEDLSNCTVATDTGVTVAVPPGIGMALYPDGVTTGTALDIATFNQQYVLENPPVTASPTASAVGGSTHL